MPEKENEWYDTFESKFGIDIQLQGTQRRVGSVIIIDISPWNIFLLVFKSENKIVRLFQML